MLAGGMFPKVGSEGASDNNARTRNEHNAAIPPVRRNPDDLGCGDGRGPPRGFLRWGPDPIQRLSHITTTVTAIDVNSYQYEYTVWNDSLGDQSGGGDMPGVWPLIVGYEVPIDDPSLAQDIVSPDTWSYRFISNDDYVLEYGLNPYFSAWVLQWFDSEYFYPAAKLTIAPTGYNEAFGANEYEPYAEGFGFLSPLGPVDGPYANLWVDDFRNFGDPPLPGGSGGPFVPPFQQVPEPSAAGWAALLCVAAAGWHSRRCWRSRSR